jgi:hypothetical protein
MIYNELIKQYSPAISITPAIIVISLTGVPHFTLAFVVFMINKIVNLSVQIYNYFLIK